MVKRQAIREIAIYSTLENDPTQLNKVKLYLAKKYHLSGIPSNIEILNMLQELGYPSTSALKLKSVRDVSGIHVVAVMSQPAECPHGRCAYCPSYPDVPQSYTGHEPSSMRGLQHRYDPYNQVFHRIRQLKEMGHQPSKIELIIQGGTFPATPIEYQKSFIQRCLDAITNKNSRTLSEAKKNAEVSSIKNVGITVETRPDRCSPREVDFMLSYGTTRVELGVQAIDDEIYRLNERGHDVQDVIQAFQNLKDAGLKIVAHMMPGLPGSNFTKDISNFHRLLHDSAFRPDMLKIYPCLVLKNSKIYEWWRRGLYTPYRTEEAIRFIMEVKKMIPPWIRIMRIQRDIPAHMIIDGVKKSNLRQLVSEKLRRQGLRCRCIRCREVGQREYQENMKINPEDFGIRTAHYEASGGTEYFISIEDAAGDTVIGYLRLRIPSEAAHRTEIKNQLASVVRELHVLGPAVPIGKKISTAYQHRGYGRLLLQEAERLSAQEEERKKILILSGLGVRDYYKRQGYKNEGPYMSKILDSSSY